ncbi:probable carbohydrate esterase At4g34215 [Prosopis cineraria]|uniref:probable carbohydrate esterase At4g34215 n=1 Tax=Prosopis cineraria TaxID=364024 RepID=UPI00240F9EA6|nr:probable carbohydrate esterase At4g34215 [Prosopis cineraria]
MALKSSASWLFAMGVVILGQSSGWAAAKTKDIFILGGQSNMAGRGGVQGGKWDGNVPPECRPNPSIFRLNAQLEWEEAHEPLHAGIDVGNTCGVGPGMSFANRVIRPGSGTVGLVPCAAGGTRLAQWSRGSHLYTQLVERATRSVSDGGTIRALLWYQGESDTVTKEDADSYKDRMQSFIRDLRSDLQLPSPLMIQVALASGEGKYVEMVRKAQLGIKLPNVTCVDARGLRLKPDKLHLTTMSQVHLGINLARAYLASSPYPILPLH